MPLASRSNGEWARSASRVALLVTAIADGAVRLFLLKGGAEAVADGVEVNALRTRLVGDGGPAGEDQDR